MSNALLRVYPSELKMPFELRKQNSCCMELFNKTDQRVAFKVKTTSPNKYAVRPASGIVPPGGSCGVVVTMRAQKDIPQDYHCKDRFLVQSIVVDDETKQKDIVPDMFRKGPGKVVEEFKLRVVYIPANPPSPVPEEAEEENESVDSDVDHEVERPSTSNAASKHGYTSGSQYSNDEDVSMISKSEDEESRYEYENQKLQEELALLRKRVPSPGGFSAVFVLFVFSLSLIVGYLMLGSKA
ncbi:hypothetical protein EJB05_20479 [Eragrostis curvula]|uniref:MSP domain-containing protein n=1 Tax=Eragrostis curvula TaxID=38414 RepID=A0A5J9V070_9POAL|nr:hypothetical protein EJB05_20464 [Eragrostis curvula]TVU28941.1 hypothetical protein EJB05_20479 [Eragrostis curvula]